MLPHDRGVHQQELDWRDSNVELINSDVDHKVKYKSAASEPAWNNGVIGSQAGLFIWRIEDFEVVPWPREKYGSFHEGDSYIALHTEEVKGDSDSHLIHDIFFWLGRTTTQDEAGTAAYKTVELDEFLHGAATQHRELQSSPSDAFSALFPRMKILRGGVRSGFNHVEINEEAQHTDTLLRVSNHPRSSAMRDAVLVHEVEPAWQSLDEGDVFILDKDDKIFIWQGRTCSPMEKLKAAQVVNDLTLAKHVEVEVLSQDEARGKVVVDYLGGRDLEYGTRFECARPVSSAPEREVKKLFRLSDASGELVFESVKEGSGIGREDLDSKDVFLLDVGKSIWIWEGSGASRAEKAMWLKVAQRYLGMQPDAKDLSLAKVNQGREGKAFWSAVEV
ncbi:Severin [Stagonosporopsis vannaccii]|nr:Severin [Stagonosporopsis vannaccii]